MVIGVETGIRSLGFNPSGVAIRPATLAQSDARLPATNNRSAKSPGAERNERELDARTMDQVRIGGQ
jgi:hypothetical protein